MAATIQTDVPLVNAPFVDPATGCVTDTWFLFLIQLWRRTGGGGGTPPETLTIDDVLALEQVVSPFAIVAGAALENEMTAALPSAAASSLSEMVFSPIVADIADQTFSSGSGFTPGTTTTLTLNSSFANAGRLWVFFDAAFQGDDQYSLNGTALTFTGPIPVGVSKVYVKGLG